MAEPSEQSEELIVNSIYEQDFEADILKFYDGYVSEEENWKSVEYFAREE